GLIRERAQRGGGFVGIALNGEEALDQPANITRQPGACAERGLFEEAVCYFSDRSATDRVDAGDRQEVGDECVRTLRVGACERSQTALVFRASIVAAKHEPVEVLCQIGLAVEILDEPPLPGWWQVERGHESCENRDVADLNVGRGKAIVRCRF